MILAGDADVAGLEKEDLIVELRIDDRNCANILGLFYKESTETGSNHSR